MAELIYPVLVAGVSALFAVLVWRQYAARRRPYQALWAFSLTLSALASSAYIIAATAASAGWFRLYYLLGAVLLAPYMGVGSLYLAWGQRVGRTALALVTLLGGVAAWSLWQAPLDVAGLATLRGEPGTGLLQHGLWLPILVVLNVFGTVAVGGVALRSAWRARRGGAERRVAVGNVLIATGVLLLGAAGGAARAGWPGGFWVTMAVGWSVALAGFLAVGAKRRVATPEKAFASDKRAERGAS